MRFNTFSLYDHIDHALWPEPLIQGTRISQFALVKMKIKPMDLVLVKLSHIFESREKDFPRFLPNGPFCSVLGPEPMKMGSQNLQLS